MAAQFTGRVATPTLSWATGPVRASTATVPWHTTSRTDYRARRVDEGFRGRALPSVIDGVRCYGFSPELLNAYREDAGLTIPALADASGMTRHEVKLLVQGFREPSLRTLTRLAEALGVERTALLWG